MIHAPCLLAFLLAPAFTSPKAQDPALRPALGEVEQRIAALLHGTQSGWEKALERVRLDFQANPRFVLEKLIAALSDRAEFAGEFGESTTYSVSGNALTVLEDFTDLRLEPHDREWIGFRVHDHRGTVPEAASVKPPWEAWLRTRETLDPARWFCGLSARELHIVQKLLRSPSSTWSEEILASARALGRRAYPLLLAALLDSEWACDGERQADQANRLLARLQGGEPEPLERHDLLAIDPKDPLRAEGIALVRNRLALRAVQERWSVRLLAPPQ